MDGYNVCIFAYGQTGSGKVLPLSTNSFQLTCHFFSSFSVKTYTMEGPIHDRGVNFLALQELFMQTQQRSMSHQFSVHISMLEIYNEQLRDLLNVNNPKKLDVRLTNQGSTYVPDLTEMEVRSAVAAWELIQLGASNRSIAETQSNDRSSRSHCLVTVSVNSENLLTGSTAHAKLWLVDLAGSERVKKSGVEGASLKEASFINKSLCTLGNVFEALEQKSPHIPYRDSKLTFLLKDALGTE